MYLSRTVFNWTSAVPIVAPVPALMAAIFSCLGGCGGGGSGPSNAGPNPVATSFQGTTGVFAAWADPGSGSFSSVALGSFAGKKQVLHGSTDFLTGAALAQPAGVEIYKASDGHVYAVDLTTVGSPSPQQISDESAATVDDSCSFTGTAVVGANYDYAGIYFSADLQTPTSSSYFYRLPGPDGVCDTADDIVHFVTTGMKTTDAPIVASGMPVATVRTSLGAISGFVAKSGSNLVLVDRNFANPVVLGTFPASIGVAVALPTGTVQGFPTGQLYVVDGNIVYVNYAAHTTSATLFTIPNWTPTNAASLFAASPSTMYFSVNTPSSPSAAEIATVYTLPADGSAPAAAAASVVGRISGIQFPVQSDYLVYSVEDPAFAVYALPAVGGTPLTLASSAQNGGNFTATASTVYYTTWNASTEMATHTTTRSATQSGMVGLNGAQIQAPLANSTFVVGGEQFSWPDDTTTTETAYETVFRVTALTTITVTDPATGDQYLDQGVAGGTLTAIDTTSNQIVATIGTLPAGAATFVSGTFRGYGHTGFIEATTAISTQDPATRDLYLLNSHTADSLQRVTDNL